MKLQKKLITVLIVYGFMERKNANTEIVKFAIRNTIHYYAGKRMIQVNNRLLLHMLMQQLVF